MWCQHFQNLQAVGILEELKKEAPKEASIYFSLGKLYKKLGQTRQATECFSAALDLKPLAGDMNALKSALERLHQVKRTTVDSTISLLLTVPERRGIHAYLLFG